MEAPLSLYDRSVKSNGPGGVNPTAKAAEFATSINETCNAESLGNRQPLD